MRNTSLLAAAFSLLTVFLFSCQKELSYEAGAPSKGSLQNSAGTCLPKTVNGTYRVNQALADSNSIDVSVTVNQTGSYTISSDTINGYYFSAIGTFTSTGAASVHLRGFGKPITAGVNMFTIKYDSSVCTVAVTVLPSSGGSGNTVFTLQTNGSNCMSSAVSGTYTQGTALGASNTVALQVNVTTAGPWTLSTNAVTGFSFSGSGIFAGTGVQTITLNGSGTPTVAGNQVFTVSAGNSTCTFTVTVGAGTATITPSTDHFIITDNSWWSYSTPISGMDTLKRSIIGSANVSGFTYKGMKEKNAAGQIDDTLYFRKSGNNYYEYNFVDYYTTFFLDNPIADSLLFLKEGLTTGATWSSPVYNGAVSGAPTKVRYDYTCNNANASVTLNGRPYSNVYQVTLKVMVDKGAGFVVDVTWTNYYAQGIGWIYQKYDDGSNVYDLPIRYYQVF